MSGRTVRFRHLRARLLLLGCLVFLGWGAALPASQGDDPGQLSIDRIFASAEFQAESYGPVRWLSRQSGYVIRAASSIPR